MKKKIKFSKSYGKLITIKEDFYKNNYSNLKETLLVNKKYISKNLRNKCKNCNSKISSFDFISQSIRR